MNILQVSSKDVKVLLFIQAPFMVLLSYVFFGRAYFSDLKVFVPVTIAALVLIVIIRRLHLYADHFLRKRFFNTSHTQKRIGLSFVFHFGIDFVVITILFIWADAIRFLGYTFSWNSYISGQLVGLCANLAANSFDEGVYTFENWRRTLIEAEELKKLTLKNRLTGLRNQTDPHFFFNSINTLSGLIEVDTKKADRFVDELCIVYRYLLRNEPDTFVTLSKELNFISSWIYIVQTRYGHSLQFTINENAPSKDACIPRLTLLAFLETILDTYVIDRNACFKVTINVKNDCVEISHSIHKKKTSGHRKNNGQTEEVKTMLRLLGLPDIGEHMDQDIKVISIPLRKSAGSHEHI